MERGKIAAVAASALVGTGRMLMRTGRTLGRWFFGSRRRTATTLLWATMMVGVFTIGYNLWDRVFPPPTETATMVPEIAALFNTNTAYHSPAAPVQAAAPETYPPASATPDELRCTR